MDFGDVWRSGRNMLRPRYVYLSNRTYKIIARSRFSVPAARCSQHLGAGTQIRFSVPAGGAVVHCSRRNFRPECQRKYIMSAPPAGTRSRISVPGPRCSRHLAAGTLACATQPRHVKTRAVRYMIQKLIRNEMDLRGHGRVGGLTQQLLHNVVQEPWRVIKNSYKSKMTK